MEDENHKQRASADTSPQHGKQKDEVYPSRASQGSMRKETAHSLSASARSHIRELTPGQGRPQPHSNASSPGTKQYWSDNEHRLEASVEERPEKRIRLGSGPTSSIVSAIGRGLDQESIQDDYTTSRIQNFHHVSRQGSEASMHDIGTRCPNCAGGEEILEALINNIAELRRELARILLIDRLERRSYEASVPEVTHHGLKNSLSWINREVQLTTRVVQDVSRGHKPGLPSLAEAVPNSDTGKIWTTAISDQSPLAVTASAPWRLSAVTDQARSGGYRRPSEGIIQDSLHHPHESALPPVLPFEEMKRLQTYDTWPQGTTHSPLPSSGSSAFGSALSPMQSHPPSRALPSPPGSHSYTGTLASMAFAPLTTQAAQSSHLQDLQHQISTKTLALQTLQREHDQLLAAFSRSQIRCNTLDKKAKVSDHEINGLTEEKIQLQHQVESLETQVESLLKTRDETSKQLTADGAQWRQIMAMSSQLQLRGADEARQYKDDRDQWNRERAALERRIQELESGQAPHSKASLNTETTSRLTSNDVLNSTSVDALKKEIIYLRRRCASLKAMLEDIVGETGQIDEAIAAMASIRQRISSKKSGDSGDDEV